MNKESKRLLLGDTLKSITGHFEKMAENWDEIRTLLPEDHDIQIRRLIRDIAKQQRELAEDFRKLVGAMVDIETVTRAESDLRRRVAKRDRVEPEVIHYKQMEVRGKDPAHLILYLWDGGKRDFFEAEFDAYVTHGTVKMTARPGGTPPGSPRLRYHLKPEKPQ